MTKILSSLLLAGMLLLGAALHARDFQKVEIENVDGQAVADGFAVMSSVLRHELPGVVIDWPAAIKAHYDPRYYGCYGPSCVIVEDVSDEDALRPYKRENAHGFTVYINVWLIPDPQFLAFVIAHELTHHVLTLNGYSIMQQHHFMRRFDALYARQLGLEI